MNIGIVKPDYKIYGGFEIVVEKLREGLTEKGHTVNLIKVDMNECNLLNRGISIPEHIYYSNQEYFNYLLSFEKFKELDLKRYDCVVSTQPPSFCINHPKNLLLFYHHMKIYYDLFDIVMEVGLVDSELHRISAKYVRDIDSDYLTDMKYYAVGSEHIKKRIMKYNGVTKNLFNFSAGIDNEFFNYSGEKNFLYPVCIGRHEFPKRTELFLQAMKYIDMEGIVIGAGGRTKALENLDLYLTYVYKYEKKEIDSERLWKNLLFDALNINTKKMSNVLKGKNIKSNIRFTGRVDKKELLKHYANSLCVVCPAYEEDYGLTAIEAMAFGKPVIACSDGGGYVELVKNGETGFIVEPNGKAIANAIRYLIDNPEQLKEMSKNAFEESRKYSWENAVNEFNNILYKTMEG
jgi:glycosyltransferase involved in cell wall biosynthesis